MYATITNTFMGEFDNLWEEGFVIVREQAVF